MIIVLYQPQIPQNTGNIVRTCAVTGSDLLLVPPFGFSLANRWLKRAGLDYWEGVNVQTIQDLDAYILQSGRPFYFFSSKASKRFDEVQYSMQDLLIFGSETSGLPSHFQAKWPEHFVQIPMCPNQRCLNLATSVGIAVYEAWRQNRYQLMPEYLDR